MSDDDSERSEIDELLAMLIPGEAERQGDPSTREVGDDGEDDGEEATAARQRAAPVVAPPVDAAATGQIPVVVAGAGPGPGIADPPGADPATPDPATPAPAAVDRPAGEGDRRPLLIGAAVLLLLLVGVAALFLRDGDDSETETASADTSDSAGTASTDGASPDDDAAGSGRDEVTTATTGADADTSGDTASDEVEPTTTTAEPEPLVGTPTAENPEGALAYGVFSDGKLYYRGFYPSQEVADQLVSGDTLGEGNLVFEGEIDPRATLDPDNFPIYLHDYILFESNSAELSDQFSGILDLGIPFLMSSPDATITVVARTDYLGDAEANLELSRQRAQAVVDYWVGKGVDPARIQIDPRGEEDAVQNATAEQAALDRRVEMVLGGLTGLMGG